MPYSHLYGAVQPAQRPHHEGVTLTPEQYNLLCELAARSEFFDSLRAQHAQRGHLTPKQAECIERERVKRANTRPPQLVDVARLEAAFTLAKARGIAQPQMYLGPYRFRCASALSANAGAIYVTDAQSTNYLGKIVGGAWLPTSEGSEHSGAIAVLLADLTTSALAYGQRTGKCAICARKLTAKESIERTIGPICAQKYGLI